MPPPPPGGGGGLEQECVCPTAHRYSLAVVPPWRPLSCLPNRAVWRGNCGTGPEGTGSPSVTVWHISTTPASCLASLDQAIACVARCPPHPPSPWSRPRPASSPPEDGELHF